MLNMNIYHFLLFLCVVLVFIPVVSSGAVTQLECSCEEENCLECKMPDNDQSESVSLRSSGGKMNENKNEKPLADPHDPIPVLLVHGFLSNSESFYDIEQTLNSAGIETWNFDYEHDNMHDPREIAGLLDAYITEQRSKTGYDGPVDIVCYSLGALITRWYMEEQDDGNAHIRQWIGIAPATRGAALADIADLFPFNIITALLHIWNKNDGAIRQLSPTSPTVAALNANIPNKLHKNTIYRVIVGSNPTGSMDFKPLLTRIKSGKNSYFTFLGDGAVANAQSFFHYPSEQFDILYSKENSSRFNHVNILHQNETIERVLAYYLDPSQNSTNNFQIEPKNHTYLLLLANCGEYLLYEAVSHFSSFEPNSMDKYVQTFETFLDIFQFFNKEFKLNI